MGAAPRARRGAHARVRRRAMALRERRGGGAMERVARGAVSAPASPQQPFVANGGGAPAGPGPASSPVSILCAGVGAVGGGDPVLAYRARAANVRAALAASAATRSEVIGVLDSLEATMSGLAAAMAPIQARTRSLGVGQGNVRAARASCERVLAMLDAPRKYERSIAAGASGTSLRPFLEAVDELESARDFLDERRDMRGVDDALARTNSLLASAGPHCEREFKVRLVPPELRALLASPGRHPEGETTVRLVPAEVRSATLGGTFTAGNSRVANAPRSRRERGGSGSSAVTPASSAGAEEGDEADDGGGGPHLAAPMPSKDEMPALAALAAAAHRAGRGAGISSVYLSSRASAVSKALESLDMAAFPGADFQPGAVDAVAALSPITPEVGARSHASNARTPHAPGAPNAPPVEWTEETRRVRVWRDAISALAGRVLPAELELATEVFGMCNEEAAEGAFAQVANHALAAPLRFARAAAARGPGGGSVGVHTARSPGGSSPVVPERSFLFLDMVLTLDEAKAALEAASGRVSHGDSVVGGREAARREPIRGTVAALAACRAELAHASASSVRSLISAVKTDASSSVPAKGNVHPLAAYSMNFLRRLVAYPPAVLAAAVGADAASPADLDALLADVCQGVADALAATLERKAVAGYPKNHALRALFLMNNAQYISRHAKKSRYLGRLLGERWLKERKAEVHAQADEYRLRSFEKLMELLTRDAGSEGQPSGIKQVNAIVDDILKTQRHWTIADANLRDRVRRSIARAILPPYAAFAERCSVAAAASTPSVAGAIVGKLSGGQALKHSPADLESIIGELFAFGEATDDETETPSASVRSGFTHASHGVPSSHGTGAGNGAAAH